MPSRPCRDIGRAEHRPTLEICPSPGFRGTRACPGSPRPITAARPSSARRRGASRGAATGADPPTSRARSAGRAPSSRRSHPARPVADREAGEVGRAEGGRLGDDRPLDRHAEEVGLELEQQVVGRGAAVDPERLELGSRRRRPSRRGRPRPGTRSTRASLARCGRAVVPRVRPTMVPAGVRVPVRRAEAR